MKIIMVDMDGTIVNYQPTKLLYFRLFSTSPSFKRGLTIKIMLFILRYFWFVPAFIKWQRSLLLTWFSEIDSKELIKQCDELSEKVKNDYKTHLEPHLKQWANQYDLVYLLSHCPEPLAELIYQKLQFTGAYALPMKKYRPLSNETIPNFDKKAIILDLKKQHPEKKIVFLSDDLIDLKALNSADKGILINGTSFAKWFCKLFAQKIEIKDI